MSRREKIEKLLERQPQDPFLHFGLAMELTKEGRVHDAIASFDRVIAIDPAYCAAYYHKGNTQRQAGMIDECRATLAAGMEAATRCNDMHTLSELRELLETVK